MPFGPEEIEDERRAKYGSNIHTDEDVIRERSDDGVVVDSGFRVPTLDVVLLVEIIYKESPNQHWLSREWKDIACENNRRKPYRIKPRFLNSLIRRRISWHTGTQ